MATVDLLARLKAVHRQVRRNFVYRRDRVEDWRLPPDDYNGTQVLRGDCEDFCLACRKLLEDQGIPSRLVYCVVNGSGHLVVEVQGWILDNLQRGVMPNTALHGYQWGRISGYRPGEPWRAIRW